MFGCQDPSTVASFNLKNLPSSQVLPGTVPIIDHLYAYVETLVDWKVLLPCIEKMQNSRSVPTSPDAYGHIVHEVTLGVSSPAEV